MALDPIYVSCHMCHSEVGEPCKAWAHRFDDNRYCDRRVAHAERASAHVTDEGYQGPEIDVAHAVARGSLCTDHSPGVCQGVCTRCGQDIERLKSIEP